MNRVQAEVKIIDDVLNQDLKIPPYQRPYRWQEKNVLILLEDIYSSWKQVKSAYRIGSVIIHVDKKEDDKEELYIVDGQQRITTVVLILKSLDSPLGVNLLENLKYNHRDSVDNIRKNYQLIKDWLQELGSEKDEFLNYLIRFCEFVEIRVTNISEAFQMFDSQNSRGKSLEPYNLLKAYHIRAMEDNTQHEKVEADRRWELATRYVEDPLQLQTPKDILKQLFNEHLFRTRVWSRKDEAYTFSKDKIDEFKGVTISANTHLAHPYQNKDLLNAVAQNYFNSLNVQVRGMRSRFRQKQLDNISAFTSLNQPIINGLAFFDYIETYTEIYKQLFVNEKEKDSLEEFKDFYSKQCQYKGSHRAGDQYLKELYKSLIMLLFDKYGEEGLYKYYKVLYAIVYRLRLEQYQVRYNKVAKYPIEMGGLFTIIENSKNFYDLRKLNSLASLRIDCQRDEKVIIDFLLNEMQIPIISKFNGEAEVNIDQYRIA